MSVSLRRGREFSGRDNKRKHIYQGEGVSMVLYVSAFFQKKEKGGSVI